MAKALGHVAYCWIGFGGSNLCDELSVVLVQLPPDLQPVLDYVLEEVS
jgi:hypothetical protein